MKLIIWGDEIKEEDKSFVGAKAFNLSIIQNKGYEIPNFFVISNKVQDLSNFEDLIGEYFDKLDTKYVAVRSSANVEDSERLSFAGLFSSYLNVEREELIPIIRRCIDSKGNPGVKEYATSKDIQINNIEVAVIVQSMIKADLSGVAFSMNPVNGKRDEIVIEAIKGTGEKLVSGEVSPDSYIVKNGKVDIVNLKSPNYPQLLKADQIFRVVDTLREIEILYNKPIDIEWCYSQNKLYILQVRPITTNN